MLVQILLKYGETFKGIFNSGNSANESAEFVEHRIDCKENYLGTECPCLLLFRWHHFFKSCPWTKYQALIIFLQSTCCMQMNLFVSQYTVYIVHCSQICTQFLLKNNNSSHMQKQEWVQDWHIKLQTCSSCHLVSFQRHFSQLVAKSFWSLKHFSHWSNSCIVTQYSSAH